MSGYLLTSNLGRLVPETFQVYYMLIAAYCKPIRHTSKVSKVCSQWYEGLVSLGFSSNPTFSKDTSLRLGKITPFLALISTSFSNLERT